MTIRARSASQRRIGQAAPLSIGAMIRHNGAVAAHRDQQALPRMRTLPSTRKTYLRWLKKSRWTLLNMVANVAEWKDLRLSSPCSPEMPTVLLLKSLTKNWRMRRLRQSCLLNVRSRTGGWVTIDSASSVMSSGSALAHHWELVILARPLPKPDPQLSTYKEIVKAPGRSSKSVRISYQLVHILILKSLLQADLEIIWNPKSNCSNYSIDRHLEPDQFKKQLKLIIKAKRLADQ